MGAFKAPITHKGRTIRKVMGGGGGGVWDFLELLGFFSCEIAVQEFCLWFINPFSYVARSCSNFFSLDFRLPKVFFFALGPPPLSLF